MKDKRNDYYVDVFKFKRGYLTLHGLFTNNYWINYIGFGFTHHILNYRLYRDAYIFFFGTKPRLLEHKVG